MTPKILFMSLIVLMFLGLTPGPGTAERSVDWIFREARVKWDQKAGRNRLLWTKIPVTGVRVIGFRCEDSECNEYIGPLWNGETLVAEEDSIRLVFPTEKPRHPYGLFFFKEGYLVWEQRPSFWGTSETDPIGPYRIHMARMNECSAEIISIRETIDGESLAGIMTTVRAPISPAGLIRKIPDRLKTYYESKAEVSLSVTDKQGREITRDSRTVDIPLGKKEVLDFQWPDARDGEYSINISTRVLDSRCLLNRVSDKKIPVKIRKGLIERVK